MRCWDGEVVGMVRWLGWLGEGGGGGGGGELVGEVIGMVR